MCGRSGLFDTQGRRSFDPTLAQRINDVQAHRGPDEADLYFEPGLMLGHRRLSVIDLATGAVTPSGSPIEWSLVYSTHTTDMTNNVVTYDALVIPQMLTAPLKFKSVIAAQAYVNDTAMQPALEPGKTYTYTITIHKTGLKIEGCTVTDWEDGGSGSGEAVMQ